MAKMDSTENGFCQIISSLEEGMVNMGSVKLSVHLLKKTWPKWVLLKMGSAKLSVHKKMNNYGQNGLPYY